MNHRGLKSSLLAGLCVLLVLQCPCCPAPATKGDLTTKSARVTWTPTGQAARDVAVGQHVSVGEGDGIGVDATGLAVLEFPDLVTVEIYRTSTITVKEVPPQSPLVDLYLALGAIFANTEPNAQARLRVTTDNATVDSLGTEFLVVVNPATRVTTVVVREGQTRVTGVSQYVVVKANQFTTVSPGQGPVPPQDVDPATIQRWHEGLISGRVTALNFAPDAQPGAATLSPAAETFVRSAITTCSLSPGLYVGYWTDPDCPFQAETLLRFDLQDIPADATIERATLQLYLNQAAGPSSSLSIGVYRVDAEWSVQTTYLNRPPVYDTPYATTAVGPDHTGYSWDVTKLVIAWHQEGLHNYGLLLRAASSNVSDVRVFDSSKGKNPPRLQVTYRR